MLFESRGVDTIMAELDRTERIQNIITLNIANFVCYYVYRDGSGKVELTDYVIDKYDLKDDEYNLTDVGTDNPAYFIRDFLVQLLMRYQFKLIDIMRNGSVHVLDRINRLNEELNGDENLNEFLKCLKYHGFSLDYFFCTEVVEAIKEELEEHIDDIKDVEAGRVIKTIRQKKRELEEEHEREMEEHKRIDRINSSYWSDYYDSVRELRGLDKDCPIF